MEHAVRHAVHVVDILRQAHAKAVEVQVRVPRDERIVRPIDHRASDLPHRLSLILLETAPQAEIASVRTYGQHVGPVDDFTALDPRQSKDEPQEIARLAECTGNDAADTLRHLQDARRNDVREFSSPRGLLKLDACMQLRRRSKRADLDGR